MYPFLYYSPKFSIPSFAFSLMMASVVATTVAYKMAPRRGLSQLACLDLAILGTIAAIIGGRLFHVFAEQWSFYMEHPSFIFQVWRGGFVSYGAFIGLGVSWILYCRIKKLDALRYIDHACLYAGPFIILMVRTGCLLTGCCYGQPSPFHVLPGLLYIVFTNHMSDAGHFHYGEPLYPTQVWEMIYSMIIFGICYWVEGRNKFKGQVTLTFLMSYAAFRFVQEIFRGDELRGVYFNHTLSTAQITGLITIVLCLIAWVVLKKKFPLEHPYPRYKPGEAPPLTTKQTPASPA